MENAQKITSSAEADCSGRNSSARTSSAVSRTDCEPDDEQEAAAPAAYKRFNIPRPSGKIKPEARAKAVFGGIDEPPVIPAVSCAGAAASPLTWCALGFGRAGRDPVRLARRHACQQCQERFAAAPRCPADVAVANTSAAVVLIRTNSSSRP